MRGRKRKREGACKQERQRRVRESKESVNMMSASLDRSQRVERIIVCHSLCACVFRCEQNGQRSRQTTDTTYHQQGVGSSKHITGSWERGRRASPSARALKSTGRCRPGWPPTRCRRFRQPRPRARRCRWGCRLRRAGALRRLLRRRCGWVRQGPRPPPQPARSPRRRRRRRRWSRAVW